MFSSNTSQVSNDAVFVEDVFSNFLYTGNGSTQTITNGIDLAGEGGLVWTKGRSAARTHVLSDTARGIYYGLFSPTTQAQLYDVGQGVTSYNSDGFSIGYGSGSNIGYEINLSGVTYASWTFRKQPKFFDVVTYTGTGSAQNIAHNLGSAPACMFIKATSASGSWAVYHRSFPNPTVDYLILNATFSLSDLGPNTAYWNSTNPTSTQFTVGTNANVNASGTTYVAYLFAHNAGGFGLTGTDNVISCGSYTGTGATGNSVTLGYEPQWIMIKDTTGSTNPWVVVDNMRGMSLTNRVELYANSSNAELTSTTNRLAPTSTGFTLNGDNAYYNTNGSTYIYIAIRRGPMKVPTDATKVYATDTLGGTSPNPPAFHTGNFPVDLGFYRRTVATFNWVWSSRLTGLGVLSSNSTSAETTSDPAVTFDYQDGWYNGTSVSSEYRSWMFRRAPSFFDEVCYTGLRAINNTTPQAVSHNLGVSPELVIVKCRSASTISSTATNWSVCTVLNGTYSNRGYLNTTDSFGFTNNLDPSNGGAVSASSITFGYGDARTNATGNTYVAYLFATCAGVSKVGSYTGTGTTLQVNCGFTAGARFVLIKRTDSTGSWYVWDVARGISSGNDPYLLLNSADAEVTSTDYIDTYSAGFEISSTAPAAINASGGTFIFLAIA